MRWVTLLGVAMLCGCFRSEVVDCGDGFLCPEGLACAAPGYCGEPVLVEKCEAVTEEWGACEFTDGNPASGSCHRGICGPCTNDRQGCTTGWTAMSAPTTELYDVWVIARDDAYAIGDGGTLLHYDGIGWSAVATTPPMPDLELRSIWGSSGDDFYIVSTNAGPQNLLHVTNRTSLAFEALPRAGMKAVWGSAPDNVYVAGFGAILRYDGGGWTEVPQASGPSYSAIHGLADATRVLAVSPSGDSASFDGTWSKFTIPASLLHSVWVGGQEAFVAGDMRTLLRHDGASWNPVMFDLTVPQGIALRDVWASGSNDIYVVGAEGKIVHSTDGISWTAAGVNLGANLLRAVDGAGPDRIFVVGSGGAIWHYAGD